MRLRTETPIEDGAGDEFHFMVDDMPMPLFGEGDFGNGPPSEKATESGQLQRNKLPPILCLNRCLSARESTSDHSNLLQDEEGDEHWESKAPTKKRVTSNDEPKPNIIVNYLPQKLTDKEFFHLFAPYGPTESIKIMRDSQVSQEILYC